MLNKINTNERSAMRKTSTEKCVTIPSSFDTKGKDKDTEQLSCVENRHTSIARTNLSCSLLWALSKKPLN